MKRLLGIIGAAVLLLVSAAATAAQAQVPTFTVLHSFANSPDGALPFAGLLRDAAGNLYGTTGLGGIFGFGTVFKLDSSGNETVLHSFAGADGQQPSGDLIMDAAGNLYGTTLLGGGVFSNNCFGACGTVFKLDPSGNETVLHTFAGGGDGRQPNGNLIMDAAGNLYGTTSSGGSATCPVALGCGTVFKLDTSGILTVLHSFTGSPGDGEFPVGGLIMDKAGNLYGSTGNGGAGGGCSFNCGIVFKLDPAGNETVLHNFTGGPGDGGRPVASLIMDAAGNLYGTTAEGGSGTCTVLNGIPVSGCGTVFKLDPAGNVTLLHSFTGGPDGIQPLATLLMDAAGNLYSTTEVGGSGPCTDSNHVLIGCGTVFKVDPAGIETVLYSFTGGSDGRGPLFAGLIMDIAGSLYGTTLFGGVFSGNCFGGCGTLFKLTVQTPQQATQGIINSVSVLFSQGVINGGQDNSLVVQLQHAISMINAGKNAGAIGNLQSFINEVNDLLGSGVLSASQAASLVNAAQSVIAAL